MSTWDPAALEALIEEATVDAYGEDEQRTGFFPDGLAMGRGIPLLGPLNWRLVHPPS
ncbi:hypothetical protein [Streptomyces sp. NPDC056683]|uniref:hypothetical protein n=1 Tax=Streptomyces sp. NPDC056683 TaxID=3345910 RepID=UPI00368EEDC5